MLHAAAQQLNVKDLGVNVSIDVAQVVFVFFPFGKAKYDQVTLATDTNVVIGLIEADVVAMLGLEFFLNLRKISIQQRFLLL